MPRGDFIKRDFFPKKELFPNRPELFPKKNAEEKAEPKAAAKKTATAATKAPPKAKAGKVKANVKVELPKARFELISYDEYNQPSIIAAGGDLQKIVDRARQLATESNVDNALAMDDRDKAWEVYFPQLFKGTTPLLTTIYAGNRKNGQHQAWVIEDGKWVRSALPSDSRFRFFLGYISKGRAKEEWFLKNPKGEEITSLGNNVLDRKTVLVINIINQ